LWGTLATPTHLETFMTVYDSGAGGWIMKWFGRNPSTWGFSTSRKVSANPAFSVTNYRQLTWDGTNLIAAFSTTGLPGTWVTFYSAALGWGAPDFVGVTCAQAGAAGAQVVAVPFLRFNWTADYDPTS
jgi:hypothetical protein